MIAFTFYRSTRPQTQRIGVSANSHVKTIQAWIPEMFEFLPPTVPLELQEAGEGGEKYTVEVYPLTLELRQNLSQFLTRKLLESRCSDAATEFPFQAVSDIADCLIDFSYTHLEIEV